MVLLSVYLLGIKSRLCLHWMTDPSHISVSMRVNRLNDSWDSVYLKCKEFSLGIDSPARPPAFPPHPTPFSCRRRKRNIAWQEWFHRCFSDSQGDSTEKTLLPSCTQGHMNWVCWSFVTQWNYIFETESTEDIKTHETEPWQEKRMNFLSTSFSDQGLKGFCILKFCQDYLVGKNTNKKLVMTPSRPMATPRYILLPSISTPALPWRKTRLPQETVS